MTTDDRTALVLRRRGLRNTAMRRAVLKVLLDGDNSSRHLTAYAIAAEVRAQRPDIHKSTIYRALDAFIQRGLVSTTNLGELANRFQLTEMPSLLASPLHTHARCVSCQRILDLPVSTLDNLRTLLDQAHGFQVDPARTAILGRCAQCRTK